MAKYQRILLKLSGEALLGEEAFGIDANVVNLLVTEIKALIDNGTQVAIVIGGGNLFRGKKLSASGLDRVTGDQMGMLATVMNGLALRDAFEDQGCPARLMSAIAMTGLAEAFNRRDAVTALNAGRVLIFVGGTGNPFVTTDSAASLRSLEIKADILLKATQVDGVYSEDPKLNPAATKFETLSYKQVLKEQFEVMDLSAFCQCRDADMPICIFDVAKRGALARIVAGEREGTLIT